MPPRILLPCGGTPDEVASPGQFLVRGDTSPERNASSCRAVLALSRPYQRRNDYEILATPTLRGTASATQRASNVMTADIWKARWYPLTNASLEWGFTKVAVRSAA